MSAAFIIVNAAMALFDLGLAIVVYRIYRWASGSEATGTTSQRADASLAEHLTVRLG